MMETFSKQTCIALIKPPWCYCYNAFLQTSSFDVTIECKAILQDSGFVCHSPFKQLGEFYDTDLQTIAECDSEQFPRRDFSTSISAETFENAIARVYV